MLFLFFNPQLLIIHLSYPEEGTSQGGVVSPILSNIYLHEVLDRWFADVVKPRMKGKAFMIRYADDAVLAFARKEDALRVMKVLPKRFGKYGLTVHPGKTRIVEFTRPTGSERFRLLQLPGIHPLLGKIQARAFVH